jgi:sialic acid synthase SpsE
MFLNWHHLKSFPFPSSFFSQVSKQCQTQSFAVCSSPTGKRSVRILPQAKQPVLSAPVGEVPLPSFRLVDIWAPIDHEMPF